MKTLRLLSIARVAVLALAMPLCAPAQDLADKAIAVWELVRDAEKDEAAKNGAAAHAKYKEATRILQEMKATDPNWNPHLVEFRLKDCAEHIADLEKRGAHLQALQPEVPPAPAVAPVVVPESKLREEVAKLRFELEQAKNDQTELQKKLTATEDQVRRTQVSPSAEVTRLRKDRQQMETQLRDAQRRAVEFQQQAEQKDATLAALKTAQTELAKTQQALQTTQRDAQRQQAELSKTAAALEGAQKDSAAKLSALVSEKSEFELRLQTSNTRILQLENQLRSTFSKDDLQKLQAQLRDETAKTAELQVQIKSNSAAATQLRTVSDENARLQKSLEEARQSAQQHDAEMKRTAAALESSQKNYSSQLASLGVEKDALENELRAARTRARELETANAALVPAAQLSDLEEKHRALQSLNAELANTVAQKSAQLSKLESVQTDLAKTQQSLTDAQRLAEERSRQFTAASTSFAASQKESELKLSTLTAEKSELEKQLNTTLQRIQDLETKAAPLDTVPKSQFDSLKSNLDAVTSQLAQSQESLVTANHEVERQKTDITKLSASLVAIQDKSNTQLRELAATKQELERQLRAANDRIAALQAASPVAPSPNPQLATDLQQVRAEKVAIEEKLAVQDKAMRATMKEMSAQLDTALAQKNSLQSQLSTTQTQLSQTSTRAEQLTAEKKNLEDRLAQPQRSVRQPSANDSTELLVALRNEKRDLVARVVQTENQVHLAESMRDAMLVQKERVEKQFAESRVQLASAQQEASHYKSVVERLTSQLDAARKEQTSTPPAPARDTKQVAALKTENRTLQITVEKQQGEVKRLQEELARMRLQLSQRNATSPSSHGTPHIQLISHPIPINGGDTEPPSKEPPVQPEATRLPDSARAALDDADRLAAAKNYDAAAAAYEKLLTQHPQSVIVLANLGVVRMKQERHDDAHKLLSRCVTLAPDDAFSHSMLGLSHYFRKDYDNALASLSRAIALDPKDALSLNYRGTTSAQKGWFEAAENDLRKAIELQPKFADAHRNLANIYMKQRPVSPRLAHFHYLKSLEFGVKPDADLQRAIEDKVGVSTERGTPAPTQP